MSVIFERADPKTFFDAVARRYDRVYALSGRASRDRLARVLREIVGCPRVLLLGVGTGRELPALLDAGHEVVGLDVSPGMIAECNKRSRTVPVVLGDFWEPLPFEDQAFDAALALHGTLAHPTREVDDALAGLSRELARVLRPGGVLVAEVPAAESLALIEAAHPEGLRVAAAGESGFVHQDDVAELAIAGVALTRERWATVLAPHLAARVEPLGDVEHLVVATRPLAK